MQVPDIPTPPPREPILTIPGAMVALLVVMVGIHVLRMLLPLVTDQEVIWAFGFVPARYDSSVLAGQFPGGSGAEYWTFLTYALLHANFSHILFNMLWMLPFGSALARRLSPLRFFTFLAVTAIAGAIAHLITHQHEVAPMIGASAAVSGAMAASIRFAFQSGSFLSFGRGNADAAAHVPALSLWDSLKNKRVLGFLAIWFGVNIVFGLSQSGTGSRRKALHGKRISAVSSPDYSCSRCSIPCRVRCRRTATKMCRVQATHPIRTEQHCIAALRIAAARRLIHHCEVIRTCRRIEKCGTQNYSSLFDSKR